MLIREVSNRHKAIRRLEWFNAADRLISQLHLNADQAARLRSGVDHALRKPSGDDPNVLLYEYAYLADPDWDTQWDRRMHEDLEGHLLRVLGPDVAAGAAEAVRRSSRESLQEAWVHRNVSEFQLLLDMTAAQKSRVVAALTDFAETRWSTLDALDEPESCPGRFRSELLSMLVPHLSQGQIELLQMRWQITGLIP